MIIVNVVQVTRMAQFVFGRVQVLLVANGAEEVAQLRARRHPGNEQLIAR